VKLESPEINRFAIGARVGLVRCEADPVWRHVRTDSSYLSASDTRVHFGLGDDPQVDAVLVWWPNGFKERFEGIQADSINTLRRGAGKPVN
jgi:hypothetical protein